MQVFGSGTPYEGLAYRIGRWFMSIVKHCERKYPNDKKSMQREFAGMWRHTVDHYSTSPCKPGCPCEQGIGDHTPPESECGFFAGLNSSETSTSEGAGAALDGLSEDTKSPQKTLPNHKERNGRLYLNPNFKLHTKYINEVKIVVEFINQRLDNFIHGYNTCFAESMHNMKAKWCNKRKAYGYFEVVHFIKLYCHDHHV